MKYYFLLLSVILMLGCDQDYAGNDSGYRKTSYELLQFAREGKFGEAKRMFTVMPEQDVSIDGQLRLIRKFLDENGSIPAYNAYELDTTEIALGKRRAYEIRLFKNGNQDNAESFIGRIRIEFREGMPEKVSTIMVVGRPVKF